MNKILQGNLIEARDQKLSAIVDYFKDVALEAHLAGSLATGASDALSDIDIWFTFDDKEIVDVVGRRFDIYNKLGNVVMYHEAQQNFPLNGNYSLVIYETPAGLLQVDYCMSPLSSSRIPPDTKVLFEKTPVQRGEVVYDPKRIKREFSDKVSFVICMCFVGIKKIVRGDDKFMDFLVFEYQDIRARMFTALPLVTNRNSFETIKEILGNLSTVSTTDQKKGIEHIKKFLGNF